MALAGVPQRGATPDHRDITLATTTSVRDAGLLDVILPQFEAATGHVVKVIAVGSGQAMELGRRGEASILVVHDPGGEELFMAQGFGSARASLMHSEFVLLGPPADPARARGLAITDALRAIVTTRSLFISRADRSGTHVKEMQLWQNAGELPGPEWRWESGQGMSATLQIASELGGYTLSDVGTWLAHKSPLDLDIVVQGGEILNNPYHLILIDQNRFSWINSAGARLLMDYLLSPQVQQLIGEFGRKEHGRSLFVPDAS